jgi:hypothetical protein
LFLQGHILTNVRVEQTYKGNFHLLANIDGVERKFIIAKNKEEYHFIESTGTQNLSEEYLMMLAEKSAEKKSATIDTISWMSPKCAVQK